MKTVFVYINAIFDAILTPFSSLSGYLNITLMSIATAVIFLYIFKKTSNQKKIKDQKDRIRGHIIQILIYNDQIRVVLKSLFAIFRHNVISLAYTTPPLLVIFVPLLICTTQINSRFGYSPLKKNQRFIINAQIEKQILAENPDFIDRIELASTPGVEIETQPLRIHSSGRIYWRGKVLEAKEPQFLQFITDADVVAVQKEIVTGGRVQRFSPETTKWHLWGSFVNYAEDFLPKSSPFRAVVVAYERETYPFLFWDTDPIILYFILTLIVAFLFKPFIKVYI